MRGKKTSPETAEEIKALSIIYSPQAVAAKLQVPLRTVYAILAKKDNALVEARREEKRVEIVDKVWANKENEILSVNSKMDMILAGLNQDKVNKARLTELTTAYGTLFDKRQLLTGKPTAINSITEIIAASHRLSIEEARNSIQRPTKINGSE